MLQKDNFLVFLLSTKNAVQLIAERHLLKRFNTKIIL